MFGFNRSAKKATLRNPTRLSLATLDRLPNTVSRSRYARSDISPGIVHIGVGNFHRAHQGVYLDDVFNTGHGHDWGIVGAGLLPSDAARRAQLQPQDWLTSVVELGPGNQAAENQPTDNTPTARVTGAMVDYCPAHAATLIDRLCDPAIRMVTLTITEGGYYIHPATSDFDLDHPNIAHDVANFHAPTSVFGVMLKALARRKNAGTPPFSVLSCDNLVGNGDMARRALSTMASAVDAVDPVWVADAVVCPNAMVDCITPATTDEERQFIADTYAVEDAAPVICEPFRQWVIEDTRPFERPPLELVGVQFTPDVRPYEELKLNLLNAGHAAIAYPAALLGLEYAHDAMADADVAGWVRALLTREVVPLLAPTPDTTPAAYLNTVVTRFANPGVRDAISRLCEDGQNRQPKFVFPSLRRALAHGAPLDGLALEIALWCRFLAEGNITGPSPAKALIASANATRTTPEAFIIGTDMFGDLRDAPRFVQAFHTQITTLWQHGVRTTMNRYINADVSSDRAR